MNTKPLSEITATQSEETGREATPLPRRTCVWEVFPWELTVDQSEDRDSAGGDCNVGKGECNLIQRYLWYYWDTQGTQYASSLCLSSRVSDTGNKKRRTSAAIIIHIQFYANTHLEGISCTRTEDYFGERAQEEKLVDRGGAEEVSLGWNGPREGKRRRDINGLQMIYRSEL